jgi:hypothetical protein
MALPAIKIIGLLSCGEHLAAGAKGILYGAGLRRKRMHSLSQRDQILGHGGELHFISIHRFVICHPGIVASAGERFNGNHCCAYQTPSQS